MIVMHLHGGVELSLTITTF